MGLRKTIASLASSTLTWGLRNIAHRPAGNLPGRVALKIDPAIVAEMRSKLREGSIVVVGTNGKTTVTNLIADVFECAGRSVLCNRAGSNLKSGIATALLQGRPSDWGVIECDELWLAKVAPDLKPTYIVLLDLFRDQLDRCGEIDRIQDSIVSALESSPETTLIFNADDPLCAYVAKRCNNATIAFGVGESMGLDQNRVTDATMCQKCLHMFEYEYRQYGQLGAYACPNCDFARPQLDFVASNIHFGSGDDQKLSFEISASSSNCSLDDCSLGGDFSSDTDYPSVKINTQLAGSYMVYNILAVATAALTTKCPPNSIQQAIAAFDPKNGRLQKYNIDGRDVLLNLAKNPTGFNQNLRIVEADMQPRGVAFFINDQVVDGHDISWIWDIDFEEIAGQDGVIVFAGGSRKHDLQVRLKYAGVNALLIDEIDDVFVTMAQLSHAEEMPKAAPVYAIANYSAMPAVHKRLDEIAAGAKLSGKARDGVSGANAVAATPAASTASTAADTAAASKNHSASSDTSGVSPIVIAHVLPDLLNLYGDGGNIRILEQRLNWREIPVEVRRMNYGDPIKLDDVDLVFLGGGPDREQKLATEQLDKVHDNFVDYIEKGGPVLAICGGYQILGRTWLYGDEEVPGLSILGLETRRPGTSADRLIGNVALETPIATHPVIGFENHAGRTYLDDGVNAFGRIVSKQGNGNNDAPDTVAADGVLEGRLLGTYLHGVLLAKNPEVADWALEQAILRHAERTGETPLKLAKLDDTVELAANAEMAAKLI